MRSEACGGTGGTGAIGTKGGKGGAALNTTGTATGITSAYVLLEAGGGAGGTFGDIQRGDRRPERIR